VYCVAVNSGNTILYLIINQSIPMMEDETSLEPGQAHIGNIIIRIKIENLVTVH